MALFLNILLIAVLFLTGGVKVVLAAPNLSLDPSTGTYTNGSTFSVTAKVNSGTEIVGGVDGVGTYDSDKLELTSIVKATSMVFDSTNGGGGCSITTAAGGKFSFSCYANDALTDTAVNGDLVVLNFTAKATGTAVVKFTCASGSTIDSNIVKTSTLSDAIVCADNINGSYVITDGSTIATSTSTPTPTPTPTSTTSIDTSVTSTPTSTTTTTELPQTGSIGSTVGLIVFGAISLASALFLKFL